MSTSIDGAMRAHMIFVSSHLEADGQATHEQHACSKSPASRRLPSLRFASLYDRDREHSHRLHKRKRPASRTTSTHEHLLPTSPGTNSSRTHRFPGALQYHEMNHRRHRTVLLTEFVVRALKIKNECSGWFILLASSFDIF